MVTLKNPLFYWTLTHIIIILEIIPFVTFTIFSEGLTKRQKTGFGKRTFAPFDEHLEGEFVNGRANGAGKEWFGPKSRSPGQIYVGDFVEDMMHGNGTLTLESGQCYKGEFSKNEYHGRGEAILPNGDTYEGDFVNGEKHGFGVYTFSDGRIESGQFERGKFIS
jgi:hypothetical protein